MDSEIIRSGQTHTHTHTYPHTHTNHCQVLAELIYSGRLLQILGLTATKLAPTSFDN